MSVPRIWKLIDTGMLGAAGPVMTTLSIWMRARPFDADPVPQHTWADSLEARSVDAPASAAAVALPLRHGTVTGPAVAGALGALTVCELAAGHPPPKADRGVKPRTVALRVRRRGYRQPKKRCQTNRTKGHHARSFARTSAGNSLLASERGAPRATCSRV